MIHKQKTCVTKVTTTVNLVSISLAALLLAGPAAAQTVSSWNGGIGNWSDSGGWSSGAEPNSMMHDVRIDNGNGVASTVTLGSDRTIGRLSIDTGDELVINSNRWLYLHGGGFAGSGHIQLDGRLSMAAPGTEIRLLGNNQNYTFAGWGTLALNGSIYSAGANNTLTNQTYIGGTGHIITAGLLNQGSIYATGVNGITLTTAGVLQNQGNLAALAGSQLVFSSGTVSNAGYGIWATGAGAQTRWSGASVRGGTLGATDGGQTRFETDNMLVDGLTDGAVWLVGDARIHTNRWPHFIGQVVIQDTLTAENISQLRVGQNAGEWLDLYGPGTLQLDSAWIASAHGNSFRNFATIRGSGGIGLGVRAENHGQIFATGLMNLEPGGDGFVNRGHIEAGTGATVRVGAGLWDNASGTLVANGTGGVVEFDQATTIRGGTLAGHNGGQIRLYSDSALLDGATNGAMTLAGDVRVMANRWPHMSGTFYNYGTVTVDSTGIIRVGTGSGQGVTFNGSTWGPAGIVQLDNGTIGSDFAGNSLVNGYNHLIRGQGYIGTSALDVWNRGQIGDAGSSLTITPNAGFTNQVGGSVVSAGGGGIEINRGTIDNQGWFRALDGGNISLTGPAVLNNYGDTTLYGGGYEIAGTGQLNLGIGPVASLYRSHVRLSGPAANFAPINTLNTIYQGSFGIDNRSFTTVGSLLNLDGLVRVGPNSLLTVNGTLDNQGYVEVAATGILDARSGAAPQYNTSSRTLTGSWSVAGEVHYSGGDVENIGGTLALEGPTAGFYKSSGDSAIAGLRGVDAGGLLGFYDGMTYSAVGNFINQGTVVASAATAGAPAAVLHVAGEYSQVDGMTLLLNDAILDAGNDISIDGGSVQGQGVLRSLSANPTVIVNANGSLSPGFGVPDAAVLTVDGRLGMGTGSTYYWELENLADNSTGAGGVDWDQLLVQDGVFGGATILSLLNLAGVGSSPSTTDPFWNNSHEWDVLVTADGGILNSFSLAQNQNPPGTFSLGTIQDGSSSILRLVYTAAIPEPTATWLLTGIGLALVATSRRRRPV